MFFCRQYQTTFWQLLNSQFSPNLATARESWVKRRLRTEIYEKFPFRGHLLPKPQTLRGQTGTSLRAGYRSSDAEIYCLFDVVVQGPGSFRHRSAFPYDVRLRSYGTSNLPNFRILAYFSHTKPVKCTLRWPAYSPGVTSQNDWFFHVVVEGPKGCLPGPESSYDFW